MKLAPLAVALLATLLYGSTAALAQHNGGGHSGGQGSGGQQSGGHYSGGHYSGGHYSGGHYSGGRYSGGRYSGGRYYGGASPYYYPYSVFGWPYYAAPLYTYPVYASRPPVVVERYYIDEAPQPPQYSYEERSYAQAAPPEPRRPAAPAPRMERITLSAKELFAFDEAKLRPPQPRLDEIAELMKKSPQIDKVRITGYTDRIGTNSYNLKLSQRRAEAVKSYLVAKGVAASRLVAVGKGEADPVVQCNDKKMSDLIKCLEPNRRVEVEEITVERRVS